MDSFDSVVVNDTDVELGGLLLLVDADAADANADDLELCCYSNDIGDHDLIDDPGALYATAKHHPFIYVDRVERWKIVLRSANEWAQQLDAPTLSYAAWARRDSQPPRSNVKRGLLVVTLLAISTGLFWDHHLVGGDHQAAESFDMAPPSADRMYQTRGSEDMDEFYHESSLISNNLEQIGAAAKGHVIVVATQETQGKQARGGRERARHFFG